MKFKKVILLSALNFWGQHILARMEEGRNMDSDMGDAIDLIGCKLMPELFRVIAKLEDK